MIPRERHRASVLHTDLWSSTRRKTAATEFCALTTPSYLSRGTRRRTFARNVMSRQLVHRTVRSKMVSFLIGLMLLTAGAGVSVGAPKKQPGPINVGMIPLLASPEKY